MQLGFSATLWSPGPQLCEPVQIVLCHLPVLVTSLCDLYILGTHHQVVLLGCFAALMDSCHVYLRLAAL